MVRNPSFDKNGMKKGAWSEEEDNILRTYIETNGHSNWRQMPKYAGIARCGKSCRLRWLNYLKPGLKKGIYSKEEEEHIIKLRQELGNKWSIIASKLPGRTDNEIKNYWHTHLKKRTKQVEPKIPCELRQKTHLPHQNKKPSVIINTLKNDIDDNSFLELYDIFGINEPFSLDELNTMISPNSGGSYNSTISSFSDEPFTSDATNSLISPSAGSCNSTISCFLDEPFFLDTSNSLISTSTGSRNSTISSYTEPSGSFLDEPFSFSFDVTNSLISHSSSCNSISELVDDYMIPVETIPATGEFKEASNNQVFNTNCEESNNAASGWTEPSWLSTFYQVLSSSSSNNEGLDLPYSASDGYDLFNYSHYS